MNITVDGASALERLRAAAPGADAPAAISFVLHCFMEAGLPGGAAERTRAGLVETFKYACGVEMQTVAMGGSLAVHVLKPGCSMLHWVVSVADFAAPPTGNGGGSDAADSLASGIASLRRAFDDHIATPLAALRTPSHDAGTAVAPERAAAPKVRAAAEQARRGAAAAARSTLEDDVTFGPRDGGRAFLQQPGGLRTPGAGLLGELEPPFGVAGGSMLVGPDHPGFGAEIEPDGGGLQMPPQHGPGAGLARWDPIHGQGRLGDPDAGDGGHADLQRPPGGIDDEDVDSMFM
jgi:hypothetical protein